MNHPTQTEQQSSSPPAEKAKEVVVAKRISTRGRKWPLVTSIVVNVALLIALVLSLRGPEPLPFDRSKYTQNDVRKAQTVSLGMATTNVKEMLGEPAVRELAGSSEEWHYCQTGSMVDEYVSISFQEQKVVGTQYYTVNWLDMAFHYVKQPTERLIDAGGMGDCRLTVRWGTYGQKNPSYPENLPARTRNAEAASSTNVAR